MESRLSMLIRVCFSLKFWEYAFKCAIHLINRFPTQTLSQERSYELFYKNNPTFGYLRTFECLCYPFMRPYASNKLKPWSIPCLFFGLSIQSQGYLCMDTTSRKFYLNHHVTFHETYFPLLTLTIFLKIFLSLYLNLSLQLILLFYLTQKLLTMP